MTKAKKNKLAAILKQHLIQNGEYFSHFTVSPCEEGRYVLRVVSSSGEEIFSFTGAADKEGTDYPLYRTFWDIYATAEEEEKLKGWLEGYVTQRNDIVKNHEFGTRWEKEVQKINELIHELEQEIRRKYPDGVL